MQTCRIIPIDPVRPDPAAIGEAVRVLAAGGLAVLPTETVYGLAADPRSAPAMDRLYAAKGRPAGKPVALLVDGAGALAEAGAGVPPAARALLGRYWPGPLTLVLDTPGGPVGFRCPDHPVALALLRLFGRPLAASSANRSGRPDPLTAADAAAELGTSVDLFLDGGRVPGGVPSTVVRVTSGNEWRILRRGAIAAPDVERIAGGRGAAPDAAPERP